MAQEIIDLRISVDAKSGQISVERLTDQIKQAGKEAEKAGGLMSRLNAIALSAIIDQVRGIADGFKSLATPAIQFEQSMHDLSAITGSVGDELEELTKAAREVGAESGLGASESARAFSVLAGQIDVPIESLKTLQKQTILLAQAGALPLEDAANAVAGTINQFGLEAEEASRVVNVLAAASRAGGAEVNDISESFKVAGAAAASAGVSVEETAGALEILAQNNTKGSEAGIALRNMLVSMQAQLGIDISKTGFAGGLDIIRKDLSSMGSQVERTTYLAKVFGRQNIVAAQYLLDNADAVREMTKAVTGTQSAQEQATIRTNTWAHKIEVARAKMADLSITITNATGGLLPFGALLTEQLVPLAQIIPLISGINKAVHSLGATIKSSGMGGIAIAIGVVVGALVAAYQTSETFRNACNELFAAIKQLGGEIMKALKPAFDRILEAVKPLMPLLGNLFSILAMRISVVIQQLSPIIGSICRILGDVMSYLFPIIKLIMEVAGRIVGALLPALEPLFKIFANNNPIVKLFSNILSGVCTVVETLVGWISKLIDKLLKLLGIGSDAKNMASQTAAEASAGASAPPSTQPVTQTVYTPAPMDISSSSSGGSKDRSREITDLGTIAGLQNAISKAQEKLSKAKGDEAIAAQKEINALQDKLDRLQNSIKMAATPPRVVKASGITTIEGYHSAQIEKAKSDGKDVKGGRIVANPLGTKQWGKELDAFNKKASKISLDHLKGERAKWDNFVGGIREGLGGVSSIMTSLGDVVGGAAEPWFKWGAGVIDAIGQALPQLLTLFNANVATAASGAASSQSSIPVVGPIMAIASVASILAAITKIPKASSFADGGILYGATYALAGEYPGASNNPEVIAPLDRLRSLLDADRPSSATPAGSVEFRIRGRELVGILSKEYNTRKYS